MKPLAQYEVGEQLDAFLLVKESIASVTQKGQPYMTLFLQDKTAQIEAKLWNTTEEQEEMYAAGKIVHVGGEVHDYRGRTQLRVKMIRPANEDDPIQLADLVPAAARPKEELLQEVWTYIDAMENETIRRVTEQIVRTHEEEFQVFPAAKNNHHNYVSGLIDHVTSMLRLAKAIADLYPVLNRDLLYAGVILHDIGKVVELSGPIATTYTVKGNLLGHITLMVSEIEEVARSLGVEDTEEVMLMQHMVLSHHGKEEWGSPKRPMIQEAEMLHYIDNIDAKMQTLTRELEYVEPGEFTKRLFSLDQRAFYRPKFTESKE